MAGMNVFHRSVWRCLSGTLLLLALVRQRLARMKVIRDAVAGRDVMRRAGEADDLSARWC